MLRDGEEVQVDEKDAFETMIDELPEDALFAREPTAYALRFAGASEHDIMLAMIREVLKVKNRYMRSLERYAIPTTIVITPPSQTSPGRNT